MSRDLKNCDKLVDPSETVPLNDESSPKTMKFNKKLKIIKKPKSDSKDTKISYFQLFRYATNIDMVFIFFGILFSLICGCLTPYVMVLFGEVTGVVIEYASNYNESLSTDEVNRLQDQLYDGVLDFAIKGSIVGVVTVITCYLAGVLFSYSSLRQIFKIRKLFLESTLNQDISWYDINKTGDFATTFTDNLAKIEEGIGEKVATFIFFEACFVAGIITALIKGWKLALVCMVSLPLCAIIVGVISWLSTKFSKQEMEAYSAAGAIAEEVLSSVRTVIAFNGQQKEFERYNKHLVDAKNNNIRKSMFNSISNGVLWFFVYACYALSFWFGVGLIFEDEKLPTNERVYTAGNMITVFFSTLMASWNFGSAAPYFEIFGTACGAATKVFNVLDNNPNINLSKISGKKLDNISDGIRFEKVYFTYPSRPDVKILHDFNLTIKTGETVALVGSSGCGKSTVIQLIQRFYDPTSGNVFIDDIDLKELNLTWLRNQIGVVGQEPALFATTIAENIRYGHLKATQDDIERAAKKANAHKFIKSLPHGYQTVIGERGAQLSGGQKQRIAIARALVRQPKILLLDEATSALDTTSEAEVQAALDAISGECTTIIVAHRLSTIRNANRIIVVNKGSVIEEGTHSELMDKRGDYYNLVISQGLTETDELDKNLFTREKSDLGVTQSHTEHHLGEADEENEDSTQKSTSSIIEVMKMNRPEWFSITLGCLSSIVNGASLPVYGLVFGDIVGVLANSDHDYVRSQTNQFSLYFLIIGIVSGIANYLQMYSFTIAGEKLTLRVRSLMFRAMLKQEMSWFDRKDNGVGALCAKLSSEAASIQGAGGIRIGTLLNSVSTFIIANVIALYYEWKLTLVLLSFFPIILLSVFFEQKFTQGDSQQNQKYLENSAKIASEAIVNIRTVASLCCEKVFYERYVDSLRPYLKSSKQKSHFRAFIMGIARSVMTFAYAAGISYGVQIMISENVDYGTIFIVNETVIVGAWSMGNAFSFSPNFQQGLNAAARIFKLLSKVPEIRNIDNPKIIQNVNGAIDYKKVEFSYPTRSSQLILKGLNLEIMEGKTVALVGSSGCGKSTIIQLLERFYDPTYGQVLFDNVDVKQFEIDNLRSHLGIVSQEPNLFDRTIAENIAYGINDRKVSMEEIVEAAKAANIHNFISSLPLGYETNLGSRGAQLSGGQKQRIAIARAIIRNPRVLLLDEATSALDNESEKIVQESLDSARKGRTCIVIAHRLTTIQDADVICVLNHGTVAEMGKHAELLERKGLYYKFYKLQAGQK